jgi:cobalt-zinc-cadmium efflux system outer membrane protein
MLIALLGALVSQQAPALTLDDAVRQALSARGRPRTAAAAVAEARAQRRLAGQIPNPNASYDHSQDPPRNHLLFDQSFSWLLTRGSDRAAAAAGVQRAEADSALALTELVRDVQIAFFEALGGSETLRLTEEQVAVADSLARIAQARLRAGDISQLEFEQAAQESRRARQALSEAREAARSASATLAHAIGWTGETPPAPSGALDVGLGLDTTAVPSADSFPAVRAAVAESLATAFTMRSTLRGRVPVPSLTAGAEWGDPDKPGQTLSVIGVAVPLPLWNCQGGERAVARARADLAAAEAREARLEATRLLTDSRIRLTESARRAQFNRDSLIPGARQLRERAVLAYRAGETGVLPVLDALRGEREVVLGGVQDLVAFQAARARWNSLFGRVP